MLRKREDIGETRHHEFAARFSAAVLFVYAFAIALVIGILTIASPSLTCAADRVDTQNTDDIYEVYLQYTGIRTEYEGLAAVEEAINAIAEPAIGVKVHIVPVFIGNLPADTAYAVASGEKIDIVNVGLTNDMSTLVSDGLLLPLDELLETHGQEARKVTAHVAEAQKINGVTYAISQYPYAANCSGFFYNKSMAEELGIEMHDGMTMEELEEAGPILKEHGIGLTSVGLSSELAYKFFCSMETFGEAGNYGVILDPAAGTQIVNLYDTGELRSFYRTIRRWYEAGYLPDNQLLEETAVMTLFWEQQIFGIPTNVTAGQMGKRGIREFETDIIRTAQPVISTSGAVEFMLGIAATCKNPEKTMDFINLIYTDPRIADLLNYGIEGMDYVPVDGTDHVITAEGTANETGSHYGSGFVQFGDPLAGKIKYPLTDDYYQELVDWEDEAQMSLSFGYSFDAGTFSVEALNIAKILNEYLPILNVGLAADVDAQIDALVEELKAAGIDEIIAANQARLDVWLEERQ